MDVLALFLFVAAAVVFGIEAFVTPPTTRRVNLLGLGLLLLTVGFICQFVGVTHPVG